MINRHQFRHWLEWIEQQCINPDRKFIRKENDLINNSIFSAYWKCSRERSLVENYWDSCECIDVFCLQDGNNFSSVLKFRVKNCHMITYIFIIINWFGLKSILSCHDTMCCPKLLSPQQQCASVQVMTAGWWDFYQIIKRTRWEETDAELLWSCPLLFPW